MTTKDQIAIAKLYTENYDVSDVDSEDVDDTDLEVMRDKLIQITFDLQESGFMDDKLYSHFKEILNVLNNHIKSSYDDVDKRDQNLQINRLVSSGQLGDFIDDER